MSPSAFLQWPATHSSSSPHAVAQPVGSQKPLSQISFDAHSAGPLHGLRSVASGSTPPSGFPGGAVHAAAQNTSAGKMRRTIGA
jgi:hypothetical protein